MPRSSLVLIKKIVAPARTEYTEISVIKKFDDWVFLAEDNTYIHFEFQSSNKPKDLARFMISDAILFVNERRPIKTIVVYSSDIKNAITELNAGSIKYNVEAFYMITLDGDKTYDDIKAKVSTGQQLTKQDLMSIVFMPLMKNSVDKATRMEQSIHLSKEIDDEDKQLQILAMLHILADKFIKDQSQLSKIREMLNMTRLAEMMVEDAIKDYSIEIAQKALNEGADVDFVERITGLDIVTLQNLQAELQAQK